MTDAAKLEQVQSVPPPPYDGDSALSTVTSRSQQQHPCSTYVRKYDLPTSINPMTHSAAEPVITPIGLAEDHWNFACESTLSTDFATLLFLALHSCRLFPRVLCLSPNF
uniref:Uncharacterized protein n=1 Tax=Setaria digitata TaxID=48799 RepID=A0A915PQK1_9BILA